MINKTIFAIALAIGALGAITAFGATNIQAQPGMCWVLTAKPEDALTHRTTK